MIGVGTRVIRARLLGTNPCNAQRYRQVNTQALHDSCTPAVTVSHRCAHRRRSEGTEVVFAIGLEAVLEAVAIVLDVFPVAVVELVLARNQMHRERVRERKPVKPDSLVGIAAVVPAERERIQARALLETCRQDFFGSIRTALDIVLAGRNRERCRKRCRSPATNRLAKVKRDIAKPAGTAVGRSLVTAVLDFALVRDERDRNAEFCRPRGLYRKMRGERKAREILADAVLGKHFRFEVAARNALTDPLDAIARTSTGTAGTAPANGFPGGSGFDRSVVCRKERAGSDSRERCDRTEFFARLE